MICKHKSTKLNSLLFTNSSIKHQPFVYTQLNDPKVLFLTIQLIKVKWFQVFLYITNNSITYQSFVYTQLNNQTVLFQAIQFRINLLFALSLNVKQFDLTLRLDLMKCYHSFTVQS